MVLCISPMSVLFRLPQPLIEYGSRKKRPCAASVARSFFPFLVLKSSIKKTCVMLAGNSAIHLETTYTEQNSCMKEILRDNDTTTNKKPGNSTNNKAPFTGLVSCCGRGVCCCIDSSFVLAEPGGYTETDLYADLRPEYDRTVHNKRHLSHRYMVRAPASSFTRSRSREYLRPDRGHLYPTLL